MLCWQDARLWTSSSCLLWLLSLPSLTHSPAPWLRQFLAGWLLLSIYSLASTGWLWPGSLLGSVVAWSFLLVLAFCSFCLAVPLSASKKGEQVLILLLFSLYCLGGAVPQVLLLAGSLVCLTGEREPLADYHPRLHLAFSLLTFLAILCLARWPVLRGMIPCQLMDTPIQIELHYRIQSGQEQLEIHFQRIRSSPWKAPRNRVMIQRRSGQKTTRRQANFRGTVQFQRIPILDTRSFFRAPDHLLRLENPHQHWVSKIKEQHPGWEVSYSLEGHRVRSR